MSLPEAETSAVAPQGSIAPPGSDSPLHLPEACLPAACPFHRPSGHPLERHRAVIDFEANDLVVRLCDHGEAHPDPDALAQLVNEGVVLMPAIKTEPRRVCDGCCLGSR